MSVCRCPIKDILHPPTERPESGYVSGLESLPPRDLQIYQKNSLLENPTSTASAFPASSGDNRRSFEPYEKPINLLRDYADVSGREKSSSSSAAAVKNLRKLEAYDLADRRKFEGGSPGLGAQANLAAPRRTSLDKYIRYDLTPETESGYSSLLGVYD